MQENIEEIRYEVAQMIHNIFKNGFPNTINVIKAKIREKWKELGYLSEKNYFFDLSVVWFIGGVLSVPYK